MSYEEFPDEFEILKGSLENEDYDRAESVLLMILQKKPEFQQAKLDLERVRGKLGSISNYEFRVRAFLDQGDLRTAGEIVAEASAKFKKNRKIKQLIEFFQGKAGKSSSGETAPAGAGAPAEESGGGADEELPNLETFTGNLDEGTMKKVKNNLGLSAPLGGGGGAAKGGLPGSGGAAAGLGSGSPPGGPKTAEEPPPDLSGGDRPQTTTGLRSRRGAVRDEEKRTGKRSRKGLSGVDVAARRAARYEGSLARDAIVAGVVALVVIGLAGLLLAVVGGASGDAVEAVQVDASVIANDEEFRLGYLFESWDDEERFTNDEKAEVILALMDSDPEDMTDRVSLVDAVYAKLREHADEPVVADLMPRFREWRHEVRAAANQPTSTDPALLAGDRWAPDEVPASYSLAPLQSNTFNVVLTAVAVAVLPGLMLGIALAWCRIALINRIFHLIWEVWYALPAVALLFIGAVWLVPQVNASSTFAGVLVGLAMVPHVAFYCRQGFENIVNRSIGMSVGLIVVTLISAVLASAARFAAEAVLVFGIAAAADITPELAPVHTMGREILVAMQQLDFVAMVPEGDLTAATRYDIAVYMTFWLFLVSLGASVLAQLLQAGVAWEGLKNAEPDSETEMPEHRSQKPFSLRNIGALAVGLAVAALFALVAMSVMGSLGNKMVEGTGWSEILVEESVQGVTSQTITFAGIAGISAALLGWLLMVVPAIVIDTRRMRAMVDCALRIPTAIPPVVLAMVVVILLRDLAMSDWNIWFTAVATGVLLAPLGSAVLYTGWSQYRRGPYVRDSQGYLPKGFGLWFARVFEFIGAALFLTAVAAGSVVLVAGLGASAAAEGGAFRLLPVHLLHALNEGGIESAAAHAYFGQLMTIVLGLLALGFIARIAAEVMARFALARRGPGIGFEDFDG